MLTNILVYLQDYRSNTFWAVHVIYTKSRAITLTTDLYYINPCSYKIGNKKIHMHSYTVMSIIIPVKLVDSNSTTQVTHNTHFGIVFYYAKGNYSTNTKWIHNQTPGTQLHMLSNISVVFLMTLGQILLRYTLHKLKIANFY
jgi:hypothetical protein